MKVLTVIVSYNFEPWLDKCLGSLLDSRYPTDIIVIDNASKDRTVEIIRHKYPQITIIESRHNLGFGKANNLGFEHAIEKGYNFVFLVNQDAWIHRECIGHLLLKPIPQNVGIVSPMHYDGTERTLDRGFQHYLGQGEIHLGGTILTFVNAAFWLVPVDIIRRLGGFSPVFYHYGEDKDFTNRLQYHGYRIAVNNHAVAYHDRQYRLEKPSDKTLFMSEFVYFLTEYANINYNLVQAFGYSVVASLKKSLRALLKADAHASRGYLGIAVKLALRTPKVLQARTKYKCINKTAVEE